MPTTSGEGETLAALAREEMREAQHRARYPMLLFGPWHCAEGVVRHYTRSGTGLVVTLARHDALGPEAVTALGEFRLQQFILCRWYDELALTRRGARTDPALDDVPPDTLHCLVGDREGRLLAYISMQPAGPFEQFAGDGPRRRSVFVGRALSRRPMASRHRPRFPSELELLDPAFFSSLPALGRLRVAHVRELTYLLRNRAIQPAIAVVAVLEAMYTFLKLIAQPHSPIHGLIGHGELEARRMLFDIGVPMLYAPEALGRPPKAGDYWSEEMNIPGRFWPFVLAQRDIREHPELLARLENFLASVDTQSWRRGLLSLRRATKPAAPRAFVPEGDCSVLWTPKPSRDRDTLPRTGHAETVVVATARKHSGESFGRRTSCGERPLAGG